MSETSFAEKPPVLKPLLLQRRWIRRACLVFVMSPLLAGYIRAIAVWLDETYSATWRSPQPWLEAAVAIGSEHLLLLICVCAVYWTVDEFDPDSMIALRRRPLGIGMKLIALGYAVLALKLAHTMFALDDGNDFSQLPLFGKLGLLAWLWGAAGVAYLAGDARMHAPEAVFERKRSVRDYSAQLRIFAFVALIIITINCVTGGMTVLYNTLNNDRFSASDLVLAIVLFALGAGAFFLADSIKKRRKPGKAAVDLKRTQR